MKSHAPQLTTHPVNIAQYLAFSQPAKNSTLRLVIRRGETESLYGITVLRDHVFIVHVAGEDFWHYVHAHVAEMVHGQKQGGSKKTSWKIICNGGPGIIALGRTLVLEGSIWNAT